MASRRQSLAELIPDWPVLHPFQKTEVGLLMSHVSFSSSLSLSPICVRVLLFLFFFLYVLFCTCLSSLFLSLSLSVGLIQDYSWFRWCTVGVRNVLQNSFRLHPCFPIMYLVSLAHIHEVYVAYRLLLNFDEWESAYCELKFNILFFGFWLTHHY